MIHPDGGRQADTAGPIVSPMEDPRVLGLTLLGCVARHATLVTDHGKAAADDEWLRQRQAIESLWHDIRRLVDELVALAEVDH